MPYAYEATATIDGRPAGLVGIYLRKSDYVPYRSAPAVRWKRITIDAAIAERMRAGMTYAQACAVDHD